MSSQVARDLAADAVALSKEHADRADALRDALRDALEGLEDMIGYVPQYFQEKWEHQGYVDRARQALEEAGP